MRHWRKCYRKKYSYEWKIFCILPNTSRAKIQSCSKIFFFEPVGLFVSLFRPFGFLHVCDSSWLLISCFCFSDCARFAECHQRLLLRYAFYLSSFQQCFSFFSVVLIQKYLLCNSFNQKALYLGYLPFSLIHQFIKCEHRKSWPWSLLTELYDFFLRFLLSLIPHSHQLNMFNKTRFRKMKTIKEKLQFRLLCRIYMNLNMFLNLFWIRSRKTSVSSFYKENNFKPCLTQ